MLKPGTFVSKCPECDGGLPEPLPKTVSESFENALVRVQGDIARLESQGALSPADAEMLSTARAELGRLVARQALLEKQSEQPKSTTITRVEIVKSPTQQPTVEVDEDDFIVSAKKRLAALEQKLADVPKWESEARKLRAMLAAAEQA